MQVPVKLELELIFDVGNLDLTSAVIRIQSTSKDTFTNTAYCCVGERTAQIKSYFRQSGTTWDLTSHFPACLPAAHWRLKSGEVMHERLFFLLNIE